jgi:hypothetical protein
MERIKERLHQRLEALPVNLLPEVERFLDSIQLQKELKGENGATIIRLGGLWAGISCSEEDIAEARREMWGSLGEDVS